MANLARAIRIAAQVHEQQTDKAGSPYIMHPLRMMMRMDTENEKIVAVMHDVVEDGEGWSFDRLRKEGFSEVVIAALECVTKRPEEKNDYEAFVRRAAANPIARKVKLADLEDNLDIKRISALSAEDVKRAEKYHRAWTFLKNID